MEQWVSYISNVVNIFEFVENVNTACTTILCVPKNTSKYLQYVLKMQLSIYKCYLVFTAVPKIIKDKSYKYCQGISAKQFSEFTDVQKYFLVFAECPKNT